MDTEKSLMAIDRAFSRFCQKNGINAAFMKYIADDGVVLRPNTMPIIGKDAISNLYSGDDSGLILSWEPLSAEVAASGELAFTYGVYEFTVQEAVHKGTYVSIWRKNSEGDWRLALDSGNEGLGD